MNRRRCSLLLKSLEIDEGNKYQVNCDLLSHFNPVFNFYTP